MTTIKAIEARLHVADVKRSAAFYAGVLGFDVSVLWPDDSPAFAILTRDGLRLQLGKQNGAMASGGCTLSVDVDDATAVHTAIKDRVSIEWGPEVYFYQRREFAFRDPDGHMIIISEVTDDPPTCAAE